MENVTSISANVTLAFIRFTDVPLLAPMTSIFLKKTYSFRDKRPQISKK